jgi:hypothetical protein
VGRREKTERDTGQDGTEDRVGQRGLGLCRFPRRMRPTDRRPLTPAARPAVLGLGLPAATLSARTDTASGCFTSTGLFSAMLPDTVSCRMYIDYVTVKISLDKCCRRPTIRHIITEG